jgi:predicted nucleotidyltransferase
MNASGSIRDLIRSITAKIVAEYQPERILLFGSYAYGVPDPDSDVDLLIIKDTPERAIDRRIRVRRILRDPQRKIPCSPVIITPAELESRLAMGDQFLETILAQGELLYAA